MNPSEYQEEWLSAYLDGELTDEQRQIVEARLATDTAARMTLEDLKRIRKMVSELAPWSGEDLRADINSIQSARGEDAADDESFEDLQKPSVPQSFDEVPQSLQSELIRGGVGDEASFSTRKSRIFPVAWLASAASVLLLLGLGAFAWYGSGGGLPSIALNDSAKNSAPSGAAVATESIEKDWMLKQESSEQGASETFDAPLPGSDQAGLGGGSEPPRNGLAGVPSDPVMRGDPRPMSRATDGSLQDPRAATIADSVAMNAPFSGSLQQLTPEKTEVPKEGALGLEALAMGVPAAPAPAPFASAPTSGEGRSLTERESDVGTQLKNPIQIAHSSAWSDSEIQMALDGTLSSLGLNVRLVQNADKAIADRPEDSVEMTGESVVLATIDPVAVTQNSLFDQLIVDNQLTAIDSGAISAKQFDTSDSNPDAKLNDYAMPNTSDMSKEKVVTGQEILKSQTMRVRPTSHSIVLFLTQADADRVIEKLKQNGQVKPQVWEVTSKVSGSSQTGSSQTTTGKALNDVADKDVSSGEKLDARSAGEDFGSAVATAADKKNAPSEKIILLLSTPPQ